MHLTLGTSLLLHKASRKMLQLEEHRGEALMSAIRDQSGKDKATLKCLGTTSDHQETQQADPLEIPQTRNSGGPSRNAGNNWSTGTGRGNDQPRPDQGFYSPSPDQGVSDSFWDEF